MEELGQDRHGDPAEAHVGKSGDPLRRALASAEPDRYPRQGTAPDDSEHEDRRPPRQGEASDRGVGPGDGEEDHRMVEATHAEPGRRTPVTSVEQRADSEEARHGNGVDGHG